MTSREHRFHAVAFEQNLDLKRLGKAFPDAKVSAHELRLPCGDTSEAFVFPFGAVVFHDGEPAERDALLERLHDAVPGLAAKIIREEYAVREEEAADRTGFAADGALVLDEMTTGRATVIALTVGQSAAMEYYEQLVDSLYGRTASLIEQLEADGTVPLRVRPMHRFIGAAVATRAEVLEVLHLLDKPDAAWNDPVMSSIYDDLRAEFDLGDRYSALESKLRSVQESLELILDVARDRRLVFLEAAIVLLILFEIIITLSRGCT